jgi:uncharacterized RDD family membrane protein YckC
MAICASCGNSNADHARFCQSCGASITANAYGGSDPGAGTGPPPGGNPYNRSDSYAYGGFWIRLVAAIIDGLVIMVATGIIAFVSMGAFFGGGFIVGWLYEALMTSSDKRATLGKIAMGLVVTDDQHQTMTFARATGRHFAKYLSGLVFCIGFIMAAFTDRKQALHDMVAGTVVTYDTGR